MKTSLPLVLVAALPAAGCFWTTTKSEGKALRRDVNQLEERVSKKEADLTVKVDELKRVLDEATKLLKRNSADIGADVEALRNDIRVSTGLVSTAKNMIDELKAEMDRTKAANDERLVALEQRLLALEQGGRSGGTTAAPAGNPDEIWAAATAAFGQKKWDEAREGFKKLTLNFPTHDRADDAQYFRGETYFSQSDWELAIREYQKVFDKFPDSSLADDALFRAAESAEKLKNCTEARAYLGALKQKYPKSTLLKKADQKDKDLKAAAKTKAKCTS
jgi:tol-pal system protein YbgF